MDAAFIDHKFMLEKFDGRFGNKQSTFWLSENQENPTKVMRDKLVVFFKYNGPVAAVISVEVHKTVNVVRYTEIC